MGGRLHISAKPGLDARAHARAGLARRGLLGSAGIALGTVLIRPGSAPLAPASAQPTAPPLGTEPPTRPIDTALRRHAAEVREACARRTAETAIAAHPTNDDEARYPTRIGTDTRALPHNERGEVDQAAWRALHDACQSGDPADFDRIPLGGTRRLGNPVGTMAVSFAGVTPTQIAIPAPPALASADRAAEAVEAWWQGLLRDVPFAEYHDGTENRDLQAAAAELDRLSAWRGPKKEGRVTPGSLFRGSALYYDAADPGGRAVTPAGVLDGPVISQFLLRDVPYGAQSISARIRPAAAESEFLTEYDEWLRAQNGQPVRGQLRFEPTPRYIATGRDLAEAMRSGPVQAWTTALLLLTPSAMDPRYGGMFPLAQPALNPSNPYRRSRNQSAGAATFGPQHIQALIAEGINFGPRAAYWQKWFVHRTLRPEAYGGLAHHRVVNGVSDYPVHDDFLRSEAAGRTKAKQGTHLLSQTAPEGSPVFSAYPGGGAAVAGVVATLMKSLFDESHLIADPVQPDPRDPTRLVPWSGPPLTVGGELNKLATNFAWGRNWMGIHWWSDAAASLVLGEEVAIAMLRDERDAYREPFDGFSFTRFDGTRVTV